MTGLFDLSQICSVEANSDIIRECARLFNRKVLQELGLAKQYIDGSRVLPEIHYIWFKGLRCGLQESVAVEEATFTNLRPGELDSEYVSYALSIIQKNEDPLCSIGRLMLVDASPHWTKFAAALELIEATWLEAYQEILILISRVFFVEGSALRSASVPAIFGTLFLGTSHSWNELNYADYLIHECAHHSLYLKECFTLLLENANELTTSPLRSDTRPILAVVHATYVLWRVISFLRLVSGLHHRQAQELLNEYFPLYEEGVQTLATKAVWTKSGTKLFSTLLSLL